MKILYENKTDFSSENIRKFNTYHINHKLLNYIIIILMILLSYSSVSNFIKTKEKLYLLYTTIYIIIGISNFILNQISVINEMNNIKKTDKRIDKVTNHFKFYQDHFTAETKEEKINKKYIELKKVRKSHNLIFIYIENNTALILDKNNFTKQIDTEFYKFIKGKIKK